MQEFKNGTLHIEGEEAGAVPTLTLDFADALMGAYVANEIDKAPHEVAQQLKAEYLDLLDAKRAALYNRADRRKFDRQYGIRRTARERFVREVLR